MAEQANVQSLRQLSDSLAAGLECGKKEDFARLLDFPDETNDDYLEHVYGCRHCTSAYDTLFTAMADGMERIAGLFRGLVGQKLTGDSIRRVIDEGDKIFN